MEPPKLPYSPVTEVKLTRQYYPRLLVASSYTLDTMEDHPLESKEFQFEQVDEALAWLKEQIEKTATH
jgi:hypothetical protein